MYTLQNPTAMFLRSARSVLKVTICGQAQRRPLLASPCLDNQPAVVRIRPCRPAGALDYARGLGCGRFLVANTPRDHRRSIRLLAAAEMHGREKTKNRRQSTACAGGIGPVPLPKSGISWDAVWVIVFQLVCGSWNLGCPNR